MIEATILLLTVSDCSHNPMVQKWNVDGRVNHNFEISTARPLKQVFSRVMVYDYLNRYVEAGVKKANKGILDMVEKERPDYVLWLSMNYEILEATFDKIRHFGSQVLGWFFDDEFRFDQYSKWWTPHLDFCLTTDKESVQKYINRGARAVPFLMYSNPEVFRRRNLREKYDLSFIGTKLADREEVINNIRAAGLTVETFGRGWGSGYIPLEQMIEIYNTSRINLCLLKSYGVNTRPQFKCKIFDICMCGGFLLCEYIPGIEDYYELGQEIVCFHNLEEAKQKIRYYLQHEEERRQIAEAGYRRAIRDHTSPGRLFTLFQTIRPRDEYNNDRESTSEFPGTGSVQHREPLFIKKQKSEFHLRWARAFRSVDHKNSRWRDEIFLALSNYPFKVEAWFYLLVGYLPSSLGKKIIGWLEKGNVFN